MSLRGTRRALWVSPSPRRTYLRGSRPAYRRPGPIRWDAPRSRYMRGRLQKSAPTTAKCKEVSGDYLALGLGNIAMDLVQEPEWNTSNTYNQRTKATIYCAGIRIRRIFENRSANRVIIVHHCLVQLNPINYSPGINFFIANFFRSYSDTSKDIDFPVAGGSTTWSPSYDTLKLNPEKEYNILFHKRYRLEASNVTNGNRATKNLDMYIPVKKKVTFPTTNSSLSTTPFYELWWTTTENQLGWPLDPTQIQTYSYARTQYFFRE